jgi:ferritin-like metal-binding protein YciE
MARKRTQAKSGGSAKRKTASSRSKTKTTTSRAKTKTASSRKKTGAARRRTSSAQLSSLDDVLKQQLADLYSVERQLVTALPRLARAATHPALREAFQHHLEETKEHVKRLEKIFGRGTRPSKKSRSMAALLEEGSEIAKASGDEASKDAALIAAAQRVEHFEIAAYGTARSLAGDLGRDTARALLDETLTEESNADTLLTKLATGGMWRTGINEQATS